MKFLENKMFEARKMEPCGGYSFFSLNKIIKEEIEVNPTFIKYYLTAKSFNYNVLEFYLLNNKMISYRYEYKKYLINYMLNKLKEADLDILENREILIQIIKSKEISDFNYEAVGKAIKFLRIKASKSQGQIIAKISNGVYQRNIISKIENMNEYNSSVPKVDRISQILNVIHTNIEIFLFYYLKFSYFGTNTKEERIFSNYEKNRVRYLQVGEYDLEKF